MKQSRVFLSVFVGVSLSFPAYAQAQQPWSNILTSARAINWQNAGLPSSFTDKGGVKVETTANPWTPPTRTQYGSTINPSGSASTDLSNINTALSNCSDGQYVLLGSGTFLIQGIVQMQNHSCTLRGNGAQSTTLAMSGTGTIWMGAGGTGGSCALTSGSNYNVGSTTLTCSGLSGSAPIVGQLANLVQCDTGFTGTISGGTLTCSGTSADNGGLFVCGYQTTCMTETTGSSNDISQQQNVVVTSVSNSGGTYTIGINTGLYMPNWAYARTPLLSWTSTTYAGVGIGLEDMTLYDTGTGWLQMQNAYASWIKGIRFIGNVMQTVAGDKNGLISNNYFFSDVVLDASYPPAIIFYSDSDTLILNNFMTSGVPWEGFGLNTGNVIAYNYGRDVFTLYVIALFDHHAFSSFDLFEGNEDPTFDEDDTFGTHAMNTDFRNYAECWDPPYSYYPNGSAARGLQVENYQRFTNLIGNAIGNLNWCSSYQGNTSTNFVFQVGDNGSTDALTSASLMRWGNVSVVQQSTDTPANSGIRFVSSEVPASLSIPNLSFSLVVPANDNLPCSLFLPGSSTSCTVKPNGGTGFSWWKVCKTWTTFPSACATTQTQPFPPEGPDESGGPYVNGYAYDIPAQIAWANLPVDLTYQKSFAISSSSWSAGTETLTFTSGALPNTTHLMGAFQLSGVNSACSNGAMFGNNSEILMTGSSSTTVQYALPSNPGVSCTGTMKFPDVRQFDERVYENDPASSTAQPAAPTGANAIPVPNS